MRVTREKKSVSALLEYYSKCCFCHKILLLLCRNYFLVVIILQYLAERLEQESCIMSKCLMCYSSKMWHQFWVQHIINSLCTDSKIYIQYNEYEILWFPSQYWGVGISKVIIRNMGWQWVWLYRLSSLQKSRASSMFPYLLHTHLLAGQVLLPHTTGAACSPQTLLHDWGTVWHSFSPSWTETAHHVPNTLTSLLTFHLYSSSPSYFSHHQEGFLTVSPETRLIPQCTPPSSPSQDLSALHSTTSLDTHILPSSSGCLLSSVPLWRHASFTPFIFYRILG